MIRSRLSLCINTGWLSKLQMNKLQILLQNTEITCRECGYVKMSRTLVDNWRPGRVSTAQAHQPPYWSSASEVPGPAGMGRKCILIAYGRSEVASAVVSVRCLFCVECQNGLRYK